MSGRKRGHGDGLRQPTASPADVAGLSAQITAVQVTADAIEVDTTAIEVDTTAILVDTAAIQAVLIGMVGDIYRQKNELPEWIPDGGRMVFSIGLTLVPAGTPVPVADITPGDIDVIRIRAGVETVIENGVTLTEVDGVLYHIIETDNANWQANDDIKIVQDTLSQITVAAVNYPITFAPQICRISDLGDYGEQLQLITDMVSSILELQQTGNVLTADGTEQNIYVEATPAGVFSPDRVTINLDNMADGDRIVVKHYEKDFLGGGFDLFDSDIYEDADGDLEDGATSISIDLSSNRFGVWITLEQEIGTYRDFRYQIFRKA